MIKKTALAVAAVAAGVSAQAAQTAKSDLSVTVDVSYVSDYVFRGQYVASDSIQPSVEATYADFYVGAWHSDDVKNNVGSETDLYAGYGYKLNDKVSFDAGVTRYTYDGGNEFDSTEVYVGVKGNVILTPSLYYYYDFDRNSNTVEVSIGHSFPIDVIKASLDLSAKAGYASKGGENVNAYSNGDYTYYVVGASIPYKLSETATLTVGVDYIYNDTASDSGFSAKGDDNDQVVYKAGISIGF